MNQPGEIYGGREPVNLNEFKRLEVQREQELTDYTRREKSSRTLWEAFWLKLAQDYPKHILRPVPRNVTEALKKYKEARAKNALLPEKIPQRFLDSLTYAEKNRMLAEDVRRKRLPEIKEKEKKHEEYGSLHDPEKKKYLDQTDRYHKLLEANPLVQRLRQEMPEHSGISSVAEIETGVFALNPELTQYFTKLDPKFDAFTIEETVRQEFAILYQHEMAEFLANERVREYQKVDNDPAIKRMDRRIQERITELADFRSGKKLPQPDASGSVTVPLSDQAIYHEEHLKFAEAYPEKAVFYTAQIPALGLASEEQKAIEEQKKLLPTAALMHKNILARHVQEIKPFTTNSTQETPSAPIFSKAGWIKQMPTTTNAPSNVFGQGISDSQRTSTRNTTRNQQRPRSIANTAQNLRSLISQAQTATRLLGLLGWFLTPPGLFTLGVTIIIILLLILSNLTEPGNGSTGDIPVSINKQVDKEKVPNPSGNNPGEEITYTINVTYPGTATDIIITDPLPEGAEYVRSEPAGKLLDGEGNETNDANATKSVEWSVKALQNPDSITPDSSPTEEEEEEEEEAPTTGKIDYLAYTKPPYNLPVPNGASDIEFSDEVMANLNTLGSAVAKNQEYLTKKFDAKYVDPFLSVIWVGAIEGTQGDSYSWNCQDVTSITINDGCSGGYYSGGWQVGYGIQVSQAASHLADDFNAAYGSGSANDAGKVKGVGDTVLSNSANSSEGKITNPSTFPSKTIGQLVDGANSGDVASQQAIAILLMDPAIGSITIAQEIAGDMAGSDNWSGTMSGWSSYYSNGMQTFSNRMKAIAEKYTGTAGATGGGGGSQFLAQTVKLTVRPAKGTKDTYLVNQATAQVIGGGGDTKGNGTTRQPSDPDSILAQAEIIVDELEPAFWGYYNRQQANISNDAGYTAAIRDGTTDGETVQLTKDGLYWCTFIVIDAYNLAGITGMKPELHLAVMNMIPYFKENYTYLDYDRQDHKSILTQVKPGDAFFMMDHADDGNHTGHEHTGLVKTITLDQKSGFGEIVTYESNSDQTTHTFPIVDWDIQNTFYPMRGFGGK